MELLVLLLLLATAGLWLSNRDLGRRLDALEDRLGIPASERLSPPPAPAARPPTSDGIARPDGPGLLPDPAPSAEPSAPAPRRRESLGAWFERFVAGRLLIWLGGAALVLAAIFLIRYSIEIGLITPSTRMIGAALFGLLLIGAGELARARPLLSGDPRIAQALVGAGLATLYATIYGSHSLHGLLGAATASVLMLLVTAAALGLSLRHGVATAVMGLTGGFLTPLLVGDADSDVTLLLAYLALLDLGLFALAWRRGWTLIATAAVLLSFIWSAWLLTRPAEEALATGGFVLLLALAATLMRPGEGRSLSLVQPLSIGLVQLAFLAGRPDLGLFGWTLYASLAAASLCLAFLRPSFSLGALVALLLGLVVLAIRAWSGNEPLLLPALGLTLLFGAGGLILAGRLPGPRSSFIAAAGLAGFPLILRAARPEELSAPSWGLLLLLLAAAAALPIWKDRQRASAAPPADLALLAGGSAFALLGGAAARDLLPGDLVSAGWLAVALLVAAASRRLNDLALASVAAVASLVAVARSAWMVPELSVAFMTALVGDPVLALDLPESLTAVTALALPALLLMAAWRVMPPLPLGARRVLPALAGLFAIACIYVWFKQAFGLAGPGDFVARGLLERTLITQLLFFLGWLISATRFRLRRVDSDLLRAASTWLTGFAAARLLWFDLVVHNPLGSRIFVGEWPILNLILVQFGLGAFWLYLARRRSSKPSGSAVWLAAFLLVSVAGTLLLVRQLFQGPFLDAPSWPVTEYYFYSAAGLVLSLLLLVAGMRLPDKALRLTGLVLLTLVMLKVFLLDAAELEGVLRILSFLGLGIVLILIGRLYGPILRAEPATDPRHPPSEGSA